MNPLLPATYDIVWTVVILASLALTVAALVSLYRTRVATGFAATLVWLIVVFLFPVLGAAAWFVASTRLRRAVANARHVAAVAPSP